MHLRRNPENSPDQGRVMYMGGAHQTWCMDTPNKPLGAALSALNTASLGDQ
jgi:hypothetical protein